MMRAVKLSLCAMLIFALPACSKGLDNTVLKGERISVLQLQKALEVDPAQQDTPLTLPDPWINQFWPQAGGYPNHAMGHLALPATLEKSWTTSIGKGASRRTPLIAAPIVAEERVFAMDTRGEITAFDLAEGDKIWRQSVVPRGEQDSGAVGGGLAYASGRLFVSSGYKYVSAINPSTGAMIWKAETPAPVRSAPMVMDDRVYVTTLDNRLLVFSAADGSPLWNYTGVSETTNLLGSAPPAADQSVVVLPLSSGELIGLRPENGRVVWEDNLSSLRATGALSQIADIRGLPVIDQGVVFAVSFSGRMVALDQITGRRLWQRDIGSSETPWVAGEAIFVMTAEQQLVALSRQSGAVRWVKDMAELSGEKKQEIWTAPVLAGGRLLVIGSQGLMLEINPQDGSLITKHKTGGVLTAPVVAANTLLTLSADGTLSAWR